MSSSKSALLTSVKLESEFSGTETAARKSFEEATQDTLRQINEVSRFYRKKRLRESSYRSSELTPNTN